MEDGSFTFSPADAKAGDTVTVNFRAKNGGAASLPTSRARLALRTDDPGKTEVKSQLALLNIRGLSGGESETVNASVNLSGVAVGRYRLAIILTSVDGVVEASLVNNDVVAPGVLNVTAGTGTGPRILTQPTKEQLLLDGQTAKLTVMAQGSGLSYQWLRNGNAIGPATTSPDLTFTARPEISSYSYTVKIIDGSGLFAISDAAHISLVKSNEPPFDISAQNSGTLIGEANINPDWPTIVITHGWQLVPTDWLTGRPPDWTKDMADDIRARVPAKTNVLVYWWTDANTLLLSQATPKTYSNGSLLAKKLWEKLGAYYDKPIHFIGHSLGTEVNAFAIRQLPGFKNIQATILDSPTVGLNINSHADNAFFAETLSKVSYIDNYYGDVRVSLTPAQGGYLDVAATNQVFHGANHSDVHERYRTELINSSFSWVTIVNGLLDGTRRFIAATKSSPVGSISGFNIATPTNVAGTTPMVRGQNVPGFQLNVTGAQATSPQSSYDKGTPRRSAVAIESAAAEIASDLIIPAEATRLDFDLLVNQVGDGAWLSVTFNGENLIQFRGDAFSGDDFRTISLPITSLAGRAGLLRVTLNAAGTQPAQMTVANFKFQASSVPVVRTNPVSQSTTSGQSLTLTAEAGGLGPFTYQWRKDGAPLNGSNSSTLTLSNVVAAMAADYDVVITNANGSITSAPATITVNTAPVSNLGRIVNLSIRANAGTGAQTLIVGFVIGGAGTSGTKPLLIRGSGPSLAGFGVTGALSDPLLAVYSGSTMVASNDNWNGDAQIGNVSAQLGAFPFTSGSSKDAAVYSGAMNSGAYSAQITAATGATGITLAEIYDGSPSDGFTLATSRLVNVSARTQVGAGGDILITGFVIGGTTSKTLLVRAIGPSLASFGVTGVLSDPKLELYSGSSKVNENDNWGGTVVLSNAFNSVGAFPLDGGAKDAALLVTLQPGSYSAQVSGVGGATGVALVEVYEVP